MAHISQVKLDNNIKYATDSSAYCETAGGTAAKVASCPGYALRGGNWIQVILTTANTANSALTLNINGTGAKPIYINGKASGSGNTTLPSGSYHVRYDGANYQFRTDGVLPGSATDISYDENSLIKDTDPYLYRQTPTPTKNFFLEQNLIGASVAWNQLVEDNAPSATINGVTFTNNNGIWTLNGTASAQTVQNVQLNFNESLLANHVYIFIANNSDVSKNVNISDSYNGQVSGIKTYKIIKKDSWIRFYLSILVGTNVELTNFKVYPQVIDLTQAFGTQIADYIYSLEQATAGSGIAWLKSYGFLTKDYYAYDSGSLQSVNVSGRKVVGFNQWDEEWENGRINANTGEDISGNGLRCKNKISVLPSTAYYMISGIYGDSTGCLFIYYDSNENCISYDNKYSANNIFNFTTPPNAHYVRFNRQTSTAVTTYNNDICINISDASKNGTYEPYTTHIYPTSPIDLRGLFKLSNGNLVADGDMYSADGGVKRKYGIVDLGQQTWYYKESGTSVAPYFYFDCTSLGIKYMGVFGTTAHNIRCVKYVTVERSTTNFVDKTMCADGGGNAVTQIQIKDSSFNGDATAFKTAMNGVYLIYELATPTSDSAIPYQNPQLGGVTEEWIDSAVASSERDVAIPVGGERYYMTMTQAMHNFSAVSYTLGTDSNNITLTTEKEVQSIVAPYAESSDKVKQTATTTDNDYRILFSGTADNVTRSDGVGKNNSLLYNPNKSAVTLGDRASNSDTGNFSFAIGHTVEASGGSSFAQGVNVVASGNVSFAQGSNVTASGELSHAIGAGSVASGAVSFAQGSGATASGNYSHAEGTNTEASNDNTHAEGYYTLASGAVSHAEGSNTVASGNISHAEGIGTIAQRALNHVFGRYNIADTSGSSTIGYGTYIEIVGNGINDTTGRSNARTLDWNGNETLAGNLVLSGTTSDITLTGSNNTWDGTNTSLKAAIAATGQGGGNVTQTASDSEIDYYELLFSSTADNTTRTESTRKAQSLLYSPSSKELRITNSDNSSITKITNGTLEVKYAGSTNTPARVELSLSSAVSIGDGFTGTVQLNDTTGKLMMIGSKNILLLGTGNTWDGTNTSLKDAITALSNRITALGG